MAGGRGRLGCPCVVQRASELCCNTAASTSRAFHTDKSVGHVPKFPAGSAFSAIKQKQNIWWKLFPANGKQLCEATVVAIALMTLTDDDEQDDDMVWWSYAIRSQIRKWQPEYVIDLPTAVHYGCECGWCFILTATVAYATCWLIVEMIDWRVMHVDASFVSVSRVCQCKRCTISGGKTLTDYARREQRNKWLPIHTYMHINDGLLIDWLIDWCMNACSDWAGLVQLSSLSKCILNIRSTLKLVKQLIEFALYS